MTNEIDFIKHLNFQGKPIFYMTIDGKIFATIGTGVADDVKVDDYRIRFYKDGEEVIGFERHIEEIMKMEI